MRFNIPRNDLARLLAATVKVVEARNTIPILSTARLALAAGKLTATATDLDIEVSSTLAATGTSGAVCVDAAMLDGIVKKLPASADIAIETDGPALTIKSGRSRFTLQTLPAEDFPSFSAGKFDAEFTADLGALFAPVVFAMSQEETRFYLNGVYLRSAEGVMTAVATDGHRLARHIADYEVPDFAGIIVPRKMAGLMPKGDVAVAVSDTRIRITTADAVITSKLVDGTFPDYERVIPAANPNVIVFDGATMKAAAERVSIVSSERACAVKLSFASGAAVLSVAFVGKEAVDEVEVAYDGPDIVIGFNVAYMSELIGNMPAGVIRLALADGGAPSLWKSDNAPGLTGVLMPLRVV